MTTAQQQEHNKQSTIMSVARQYFLIVWLTMMNMKITLVFFAAVCVTTGQITIVSGPNVTYWKGCILRKKPMMDSKSDKNDPCNRCALTPNKRLVVRRKGYPQRMYNCTQFCSRVTLCTHARYHNGKDKETFPLCYHCQNFKNEPIKFHMVTQEQLCPEDCATCIGERDMPRAFECARKCQGLPTFCYPREYLMVHRKCYQAESWYGCDFFPVSPETRLTSECRECANLTKNEKEAQECSVDCDGLPTYSKTDRNGKLTYISCKPAPPIAYADLFLYEIPRFLMRHFQVSNPNTLYPADLILKLGTFGGFLRKFINAPFNMTLMTFPRPRGFEDKRIL